MYVVGHCTSFIVLQALKGSDCEGFSAERDGSAVVAARPYGSSSRSRTARVTVRLPDGSLTDYFLRVSATGPNYSRISQPGSLLLTQPLVVHRVSI